MAIEHEFPFFEVDAVARVAWPYGRRFSALRTLDLAKAADHEEARALHARWRAWPLLADLISLAWLGVTNARPPVSPERWAMLATPLHEEITPAGALLQSVPGGDPKAWVQRGPWRSHVDAFEHAKRAKITSGDKPIFRSTANSGAEEEQRAVDAAYALINRSIQGDATWTFQREASPPLTLPPMVRVVAFGTQMINNLHEAIAASPPGYVHVYDQAWAFQINRLVDGPPMRTEPDPDGEILLLVVEIDGGCKWMKKPQGSENHTAAAQSDRSRALLAQGVDVFRIDAKACAEATTAADAFEALWRAINARVFAESVLGKRAEDLVYVSDSDIQRYVGAALEETGVLPKTPSAIQRPAAPADGAQPVRRKPRFSLRRAAAQTAREPDEV